MLLYLLRGLRPFQSEQPALVSHELGLFQITQS
jgi:hypothetical protein